MPEARRTTNTAPGNPASDEARLLALATRQLDPRSWANAGPRFFMAGWR